MITENENKRAIERLDKETESSKISENLKKGRMEKNSFLEPLFPKMCQTYKSISRSGLTSVSRIPNG